MKQVARQFVASVRRLFTQPLGELNRWQLAARYAVGLARYGAHELREDRASQMAAALTYRTIFSLVPMFVLSLLVFNAFGGFESVRGDLQKTVYQYLGLDAIALEETPRPELTSSAPPDISTEAPPKTAVEPSPQTPPTTAPEATAEGQPPGDLETKQKTKARVDQLLTDLQNQVASVNFTSIGLVGLALLIWAALSLVVSLENCFNRVYHAPQGRPWHLRITIYWAVITLGPVLLALSFYMTNQLVNSASSITGLGWFVRLLTPFASLAATWLLLLLIYSLLPNAKVQVRAALIGSLVAAVMWEISKWGFRLYVEQAVGYSALYGSLGIVPLFLLWLYVTWLVILFGLEISYVSQTIKDTRFVRSRASLEAQSKVVVDATSILAVAAVLGRSFDQGQSLDLSQIASTTGLPHRAAEAFVHALQNTDVLHQLDRSDDSPGSYTLARPAELISIQQLLDAGYATSASVQHDDAHVLTQSLRSAQHNAAQDRTLRDLIGQRPNDT